MEVRTHKRNLTGKTVLHKRNWPGFQSGEVAGYTWWARGDRIEETGKSQESGPLGQDVCHLGSTRREVEARRRSGR